MSAYTLNPASGVYSTVVSVVGAGRLRGLILSASNNSSQDISSATIRLTVDSVVFQSNISFAIKFNKFLSVRGVFYTSGGLVCTLLPAIEFDSNLKIEVMQVGASGSFTLYELHELEV